MTYQKNIIPFLVVAVAALVAGWNASTLFAWDRASVAATGGNTASPLNKGGVLQRKDGNLTVGEIGLQGWKFAPSTDCLSLKSAQSGVQAWSQTGTAIGSGACPPVGIALDVVGKLRMQGGVQGDILTDIGDGAAIWKTPTPSVIKVLPGKDVNVSTTGNAGEVVISAIAPSGDELPGWAGNPSGPERVPVAGANGSVSWGSLPY